MGSALGSNEEYFLPDLDWGEDTDYLFNQHPLPQLTNRPSDTNARVLGRMLRQKLCYRIKLQTGREPSKRAGKFPDPFASDPGPPNFYEWRFTPEYLGFPLGGVTTWSLAQIRDCNNALENGDLYLVDVRNPGPRPLPKTDNTERFGYPRDPQSQPEFIAESSSKSGLRKRLVDITHGAFTCYIVQATGNSAFNYKDVLTGNFEDHAAGLPGWKWVFPEDGVFTKFPANNSFWSWSTDELLHALHGLLTKNLRLVRNYTVPDPVAEAQNLEDAHALLGVTPYRDFESPEAENQYPPPEKPVIDYNQPINLDGPVVGIAQNQLRKDVNDVAPLDVTRVYDHGLDDLVAQLSARSQSWKDDRKQLLEYKQKEQDLIATNLEQSNRIKELEKALAKMKDLETDVDSANTLHPAINVQGTLAGMEAFYSGQLGELRAMNEELKEIIEDQEAQVRDADYLRDRNRILEKQLAEKSVEASSAYEALAAIAGAGVASYSTPNHQNLSNSAKSSANNHGGTRPGAGRPKLSVSQPQGPPASIQPRPSVEVTNSRILRCDQCKAGKKLCEGPGKPCVRCRALGQVCTFNMTDRRQFPNAELGTGGLNISETVQKARKMTQDTAQFLAGRNRNAVFYQNTPQGQYRPQTVTYPSQTQYGPQGQFSSQSQFAPQGQKSRHSEVASTSTIDATYQSQKRKTMDGLPGESSKRVKMGDYQSPYTVDDES